MEIGVTSNAASAEQMLALAAYPFVVTIDPVAGAEVSDEDLALANDFVRFLRPPPEGKVAAFTDLLLHDMGPGLADICRGGAGPAEFRTEPLMGLRFRTRYLHDARSSTLTDAITQHGGEATNAVSRFTGLSRQQQDVLIAYLNTL
jgi:hypothetical protein